MTLITLDTHSRDIVNKLIEENVKRPDEFQWQSQLKFYWSSEKQVSFIKIADALIWYGYEYLGNGPRLVITPLTDRIYVTATQALNLSMGCAPAGPAGTGKTETTKDLSSAVGKACYVFNCSGEMNYETMGNIFKGLASSGCWGCFDEFNRLVPEVLSVCSIQFKAVTDAIKSKVDRFSMEDEENIFLDPSCGVFITMNPGYLGRSELPEGLKVLFRPITVVVPDFELICENILMAEGFVGAKNLAKKFVTLYRLNKSLLSAQDHYDWGMRAIKSVLVVAGTFKRAEPNIPEESLLFRALRDFNYPKIAAVDLGIFNGLLGDIFPGIEIQRKVNDQLEETIKKMVLKKNFTPDNEFILKIVQLSELLEIRHCVFLMGPPGSGKTSTWKILAKSQTEMGIKTTYIDIDPKIVSTQSLYGYTNMTTKEWKNGLLSHYMQQFSEELTDGMPKWIILDGDLDANWIESMNSVMDDNKLLTLANNGRIVLKKYMKLLFEIRDLKYATPATVSRAGILYISDDSGYQRYCYANSFVELNFQNQVLKKFILKLFEKYMEQTISFLFKECKFNIPISFFSMVVSTCKIFLYNFNKEISNIKEQQDKEVVFDLNKTEYLFVYSAVWGFGGSLSEKDGKDYRKNFSNWWKNHFKPIKFPQKGSVYDYYVQFEDGKVQFEEWKQLVQTIDFDSSLPMNIVTVPIPETVSIQSISMSIIFQQGAVLYFGNAGAGKTQLIKGLLKDIRTKYPDLYYHKTINFNYYTDSNYLQSMLEQELIKQGNRYGPKKGSQIKLIYFIDDLNMPQLDSYNTQTAISLLRQHIDYGHWFDISKNIPIIKEIINTQIIAAMNPTSGSFFVNPRYQRHFWQVSIVFPELNSLILIYETFLKGHFKKFKSIVQEMTIPIIKAAISIHEKVINNFRKTAINFHYEFNIRHLANIFQGILQSNPHHFFEQEKIVKLWLHESERIYCDRLVSSVQIQNFKNISFENVKKTFPKFNFQRYFSGKTPDPLIFTNFPQGFLGDRYYDSLTQSESEKYVKEALREYNEQFIEMNLVLFDQAIQHVCKITRIIQASGGHALLVGVGGSGKQSLSKLSAFICNLTPFSITVSSSYSMNDLKADFINIYKKAGQRDEGIMFLITDSHITKEEFLVYINDLLSSGEIAEMYTEEDKQNIVNVIRPKVKADGKPDNQEDCWQWYIEKIKQNLHVSLCFSPVGDQFRTRARRFPGLINCTVIDWFQPWPEDALLNVAESFLQELQIEEQTKRSIIDFMPYSFIKVNNLAASCYEKERRHIYTTPKTFLELIKLFLSVYKNQKEQLEDKKSTYELGLVKLEETEQKVSELEDDLKIKSVEVEKKKEEADKVAEIVGIEKQKVEIESQKAKLEEDECTKIKIEVTEQQIYCEAEVEKLIPLVTEAKEKVQNLRKEDITNLKALKSPPPGVDWVFQCILYMFSNVPGFDNDIEINPKTKLPKSLDWKSACLKIMANPQRLIQNLLKFPEEIDANRVPAQNFSKIQPYFEDDLFKKPEEMKKKSEPAYQVLLFLGCMREYYTSMCQMIPKREALKAANEKLNLATKKLNLVKEEVAKLEADLSVLIENFDQANMQKNAALAEAEKCQLKLNLAQRLVKSLGSEKGRWADQIVNLQKKIDVVTGDSLISSAFISYAGPFTKFFREKMIKDYFIPFFEQKHITRQDVTDITQLLVDDATKAEWNNQKLPSDQFSIENGSIVTNSERYTLTIDPQQQGITWIREKEQSNKIIIMRIGAKNYIQKLENCIENGTPIMLENLEENIDPVIFPIIARSTFRKAGKKYLKFSGKDLLVNEKFRLYLQTKLSNPHYQPEIQAETTIVNFMVTEEGLSDQLLNLVVSKERPDLSKTRQELISQQNKYKIKLGQLEKELLNKLTHAQGDILEDIELIENLENSQKFSVEIREKVEIAMKTEENINYTSEFYRPTAIRGSLIFFVLGELYKLSSFYMYSLESFINIICRAIKLVQKEYGESIQSENEIQNLKEEEPITKEQEKQIVYKEKNGEENFEESQEKKKEEGEKQKLDNQETQQKEPLTPRSLTKRVQKLTDSITYQAFHNVRRGLFEQHKLIFSSILTLRIFTKSGQLNQEEVNHFIMGKTVQNCPPLPENLKSFLTELNWKDCRAMEYIEELSNLCESLEQDQLQWKKWYGEEKPEEIEMPKNLKEISPFHKIMIIKLLRPDRITSAIKNFVYQTMGERYIDQPPFVMEEAFRESNKKTSMFFVLFPGIDPTKEVESIGNKLGFTTGNGKFINISMGQGQEQRAIQDLEKCGQEGKWIFLQNVHLMQSWLKLFERKLEEVQMKAHKNFRCFISSEGPPLPTMQIIPEPIIQNCIKISNQAPQDLKANMRRAISNFNQDLVDKSSKPNEFKSIMFAMCYFHSIVTGRKKFGSQGWSRIYNFNDGDLTICIDVLYNYLEKYDIVPYDDLRYIYGEIMYGGHITDEWDRRTNNTYLKVLIRPELLQNMNLIPSHGPIYRNLDPNKNNFEDYYKYIEKLPNESPLMFGMHPNAEINYLTTQADIIFKNIIDLIGGSSKSGGGDSQTPTLVKKFQEELPEQFNMIKLKDKQIELSGNNPTPYQIVAIQECDRMNLLLGEILVSLEELGLGLAGALNMTESMESLQMNLSLNRTPDKWGNYYHSKKPLNAWFEDLNQRYLQLFNWSQNLELPVSVCLSYLFNPMSFLTAIIQTTSREKKMPLDDMVLETIVTQYKEISDITKPPSEGAYIHGLFLEGAAWEMGENEHQGYLIEQRLKELHPPLPIINMISVPIAQKKVKQQYQCPVYYTTMRGPTFVFTANLNMESDDSDQSKWVLLGVAAILNEDS